MAHPQSNVSLAKFGGLPSESWTQFESQHRRVVEVANVENAQRSGYLQLHLQKDALQYYFRDRQYRLRPISLTSNLNFIWRQFY